MATNSMAINIIKNIFHMSDPCIYIRNKDSGEIWTNQRFNDILGYTTEDLNKMNIRDIRLESNDTDTKIRIKLKNNSIVHSRWDTHMVENNDIILITIHSVDELALSVYQNETRNHLNGIIGFSNILIHDKSNINEYIDNITKCGHMISESLDKLSANRSDECNRYSGDVSQYNANNPSEISESNMITILHIEDNHITVELTKAMLSNFNDNINYCFANTGGKGLELIRTLKPEIILLDINLPDANGRDIYNIVKKEGLLKGRHVIFISALDNDITTDNSLSPETEHYFRKPISGYQFCKLLNSTIENIYTKYYE